MESQGLPRLAIKVWAWLTVRVVIAPVVAAITLSPAQSRLRNARSYGTQRSRRATHRRRGSTLTPGLGRLPPPSTQKLVRGAIIAGYPESCRWRRPRFPFSGRWWRSCRLPAVSLMPSTPRPSSTRDILPIAGAPFLSRLPSSCLTLRWRDLRVAIQGRPKAIIAGFGCMPPSLHYLQLP